MRRGTALRTTVAALAVSVMGGAAVAVGTTTTADAAPATVVETIAAAATASSVAMGDQIGWAVGYSHDAGVPITGVATTLDLKQWHTAVAGTAKAPPDWSVAYSSDGGVTYSPTPGAGTNMLRVATSLVPSRATGRIAEVPPPISTISTAVTSGDGFAPIIVGTRAYLLHHHLPDASKPLSCIDLVTSTTCAGYPRTAGAYTSMMPGVPVVIDGRLWYRLNDANLGIACFDPVAVAGCGRHDFVDRPQYIHYMGIDRGSQPVAFGTRIFMVADDHKIYCYDTGTAANCPSYPRSTVLAGIAPTIPRAQVGGGWDGKGTQVGLIDVALHDSNLYASLSNRWANGTEKGWLHCISLTSGAACPGWSSPVEVTPSSGDRWAFAVFFRKNADGERTGVCLGSWKSRTCTNFDGSARVTKATDLGANGAWGVNNRWGNSFEYIIGALLEAEGPTRTYHHVTAGDNQVICWDWVTDAPCTGGGFVDGIKSNFAPDANGAYGFTTYGTCAFGSSDNRVFMAFSTVTGAIGCTSQFATLSVRPSAFYCDGKSHPFSWDRMALRDTVLTAGEQFTSVEATLVDTATGETVLGPVQLIGGTGVVDLGTVPASVAELRVDVTMDAVGTAAWTDGSPPRIELLFDGDPVQSCVTTAVAVACAMSPRQVQVVATTAKTGAIGAATASVGLDPSCGGTVTGTVRLDADADGTVTSADPPGVGIPVEVVSGGSVIGTTNTDATGSFSIYVAPPGTYTVRIPLVGRLDGYTSIGEGDGTDDGQRAVSVTGGSTVTSDFILRAKDRLTGRPT
jgi:hypothetical protein